MNGLAQYGVGQGAVIKTVVIDTDSLDADATLRTAIALIRQHAPELVP